MLVKSEEKDGSHGAGPNRGDAKSTDSQMVLVSVVIDPTDEEAVEKDHGYFPVETSGGLWSGKGD